MNAGCWDTISVFGLKMCPYGHMPVSYFFITVFPNLENLESSSIINIPLSIFSHKEKYNVCNTSLSDEQTYKFKMQGF